MLDDHKRMALGARLSMAEDYVVRLQKAQELPQAKRLGGLAGTDEQLAADVLVALDELTAAQAAWDEFWGG